MKFKMLKAENGAANEFGSASRRYREGEVVDCDKPWKAELGEVFVERLGVAEWIDEPEAKDAGPAPSNKAIQTAPQNKAVHRGFGNWFVVDADGRDVSGPHKKDEVIQMGLLEAA